MTVATIAWRAHPDFSLVLLFNRSEAQARPTAAASWWSDPADVLAGRDLQGHGTWLAVSRHGGRFALVTNYEEAAAPPADAPSRGALPLDYLASGEDPVVFARRFMRDKGSESRKFAPFNLIVGNPRQAHYAATRSRLPLALTEGLHTLSNGLLDQSWPQSERLGTLFGAYIKAVGGFTTLLDGYPRLRDVQALYGCALPMPAGDELTASDIAAAAFVMLADRHSSPAGLPETGLSAAEAQRRSAVFVAGGDPGTRSSTVFIMGRDGGLHFEERSFDAGGVLCGQVLEQWQLDPAAFGAPA
jgi:uncharacterized protein with NRDE domain